MCCLRLTENTGRKIVAKNRHLVFYCLFCIYVLWQPYGIEQTITFFRPVVSSSFILLMAALMRIADADIILFPVVSFFLLLFSCLISAVADWMSTILLHMVWPGCEFRM